MIALIPGSQHQEHLTAVLIFFYMLTVIIRMAQLLPTAVNNCKQLCLSDWNIDMLSVKIC